MKDSSQTTGRIQGLDGWRGLAVLMVLVSHGTFNENVAEGHWVQFFNQLPRGEDGVRIFFCLSGFLITHLLLTEEVRTGGISLSRFYARRALRILPVYFAYILAIGGLNHLLAWGLKAENFITPSTFSTGLWLRRYDTWVFAHFWSLSVEEVFYLIWPFFMVFAQGRWRVIPTVVFLLVIPVWRMLCVGTAGAYFFGFGVILNLDYLMMGCLAALLFDPAKVWLASRRPSLPGTLQWIGLGLFALVWAIRRFGTSWGLDHYTAQRFDVGFGTTLTALGLSLAIASTSLAPSSRLTCLLNWKPLAGLGFISYSVYTWQQAILNPFLGEASTWRRFPINILVAIAAGWLSYHCFEKWFLRLKARFAV